MLAGRIIRIVAAVVSLWVFWAPAPVGAVNPDEMLADTVLEKRARELSKGLRCVVCRNQSIDDSNAAIARDMRLVLRERLAAGDTDKEATAFLVDRFGIYVLLKPPLHPSTYLLWAGPALLLLATGSGFFCFFRRRRLDAEEGIELGGADKQLIARVLEAGDEA